MIFYTLLCAIIRRINTYIRIVTHMKVCTFDDGWLQHSLILYLLRWGSFRRHVDILVLSNSVRPYIVLYITYNFIDVIKAISDCFFVVYVGLPLHFLVNFSIFCFVRKSCFIVFFSATDRLDEFVSKYNFTE